MADSPSPRSAEETNRSLALALILIFSISLLPIQGSVTAFFSGWSDSDEGLQRDLKPQRLERGKAIERELSGGESHLYQINLTAGQYLKLVVDQRGIDVVVALFTPDGKKAIEVNSPYGSEGEETLSAISEVDGAYRMEVRSDEKTAKKGRYQLKVDELKVATAEDRYRVTAESIFREADHLSDGTLDEKRKSIEKYKEALALYQKAGDRSGEGSTNNNIGYVQEQLGEMQEALASYDKALSIKRVIGDRTGEAEALTNIGAVYSGLGEQQKALEKYNEALPLSRAVGDRRLEGVLLNNIGSIYKSLGDLPKAIEKFNEALLVIREVGVKSAEIGAINNIGHAYYLLGETKNALEKYEEALAKVKEVGDRRTEANLLDNIATVYLALGEIQKAQDNLNEALVISRAMGDRRGQQYRLHNIGYVYQSLGEMEKALEKYNESYAICVAIGDSRGQADTLRNMGLAYRSLGDLQKAMEKLNESLPISRAVGDRGGEAFALHHIGLVFHSLGEKQKALEKYNEALQISRQVGNRVLEGTALHNIAAVCRALGEFDQAFDYYNKALLINQAAGNPNIHAVNLLGLAQMELERGKLAEARQLNEQAIRIIESLRSNIGSQDLRASYLSTRQDFYRLYIEILMQLHKQNPTAPFVADALAVNERARARSLLELLSEARADIRRDIDRSLLERERSLQLRLSQKAAAQLKLLNREHASEQADAVAKEIASITEEYDSLEAQIRASSPRYSALTQPQPLSLGEIQQQVLDPETLLLEYSLGEDSSYLFLVSNDSIESYQLPKRAEIENATRQMLELLTAPQPRPGETASQRQARIREASTSYWAQAASLSQMLLGPAASQLGTKRLLIVTDGALQYLPFGVMPVPEIRSGRAGERKSGRVEELRKERAGEAANHRRVSHSPSLPPLRSLALPLSLSPLIVEHEIVHLPSASTLAILRRELAGRQPAPKAVAVLADPVFSPDDARVKHAASDHGILAGNQSNSNLTRALSDVRGELSRLLMTRDEAKAILSITPPNDRLEALDFRASRATSTSWELSQYRIIHFATHGLLNSEHPRLSGIVLSLVDERGQPQDGFLQLNEIYNLKLPANLVVLSACQTGLGKEIKGEGLVGLTRGFMYAGAARVAASLWKVDDAATAELMKLFYQKMLQDGMRPAAALRAAQIEMWKRPQWTSPFYWGAFILQGEWK